jgi:predicted protein tyrosine phosphatase
MNKYLFLCSMGLNRSPTACFVSDAICRKKNLQIDNYYSSIDNFFRFPEKIQWVYSNKMMIAYNLNRFEKIFVMEKEMKITLVDRYHISREKIFVMHIPDEYNKGDKDLVSTLENVLGVLI